jgi:hypothetical protein
MKHMERHTMLTILVLAAQLSYQACSLKVDESKEQFLARAEASASASASQKSDEAWASLSALSSSVEAFGAAGVEDWPTSLMAVFSRLSLANSTVVGASRSVPANRQQMYFRPVSTTLQCVMVLTIASLLLYTVLAISRNKDELAGAFRPSGMTQMLTMASRSGNLAPMLCMLFVSCRMYVLATTEGLGEPPQWVKTCMWLAVGGFGIQLLVVFIVPSLARECASEEAEYDMSIGALKKAEQEMGGEPAAKRAIVESTGEQNDTHPALANVEFKDSSGAMKIPVWILQIASLCLVYGGVGGVVVGIVTFPAQSTKISPAVLCTVCLSVLYFFVTLVLWTARALPDAQNDKGQLSAFCESALAMSSAVRKAPMFAVLFLASRMRALNLDPPYGMPPVWMQILFYTITGLVFLETFIAAIIGATGKMKKAYYGVYIFATTNKPLLFAQFAAQLIPYVCLAPIIYGVIEMTYADGSPAPLSTTLKAVISLECAYFGVMFWQGMILLMEELTGEDYDIQRDASIAAGISLGLAPLLCILFVATRMRALQITQQMGAPPGWAQDCMNLAVFACCVQSLCCLLMPIFVGSACKVDEDGNPDYDLEPMIGAYAVAVVKYVMLMILHASVITVCVAVYVMTPDTAHDGGRFIGSTKALFKMVAWTLVIFAIALLFSSAKVVGLAIKFAIESADKALLGVEIEIKKVALNAFKGYVHIQRLVVQQPKMEMIYEKDEKGKLVGKETGKVLECGEGKDWENDYIAKVGLVLVKINLWRLATTMGKEFELENLSISGIHFNFEKPSSDLKVKDSNVEYITNHLDALGLIPPPEDPAAAKEEPKPKEEPKTPEPEKKEEAPAMDTPLVILHKIELGDIGAHVTVKKVKVIGKFSFNATIGKIQFDDIQRDIFGGREDLSGGETVACIIKAIAAKIAKSVFQELPSQMATRVKQAAMNSVAGCGAGLRRLTGSNQALADADDADAD